MHKRDYLVKQFEEFGKVIAILFGLKRDNNETEFYNLINDSAIKYSNIEIEFVESLNNENLLLTLTEEKN